MNTAASYCPWSLDGNVVVKAPVHPGAFLSVVVLARRHIRSPEQAKLPCVAHCLPLGQDRIFFFIIFSKCFGGSAFGITISGFPVARAKPIPDDVDAEIYEEHGQEQQKRSAHKLSSAAIRKRFDPKENSFSWSRRPRSTLPSVVLRVLSFTFFQAILREVVKLFVARGGTCYLLPCSRQASVCCENIIHSPAQNGLLHSNNKR